MNATLRKEFIEAYATDRKYAPILQDLRDTNEAVGGEFPRPGLPFSVIDGLLYNHKPDGTYSLCVPFAMVKSVLEEAHDLKHHFGPERMLHAIRDLSIHKKSYLVKKYVAHCPVCRLNATDRSLPNGDYQPILPQSADYALPMSIIAIDYITGLPELSSVGSRWHVKGFPKFNCLMPVTDKATKRTLLIPGHTKYKAEHWGDILARELMLSDWGVPRGIISDRDRKFTSELWDGMWKALGTRLLMTAAYHPQADGLAERKNQTV